MLNVAPNADGVVPDEAMALYKAFGAWVTACYYGVPAATSAPPPGPLILLTIPSGVRAIDRVIAMEDLTLGE